ncbi:MAG: alkaline phosphatase D family protein [Burkholderiales bacterium]|nr:alkaline phosphatase D family protein [Burkholderiales bacterium]
MKPIDSARAPSLRRRQLLAAAWSLAGAGLLVPALPGRVQAQRFRADPFTLGVASGCPRPDGIVLWTRLAPDPLNAGGMPPENAAVRWELARDESFHDIARRGEIAARPEFGHSVHVELRGLEPDRTYWYRFMAGDAVSAVGRTRTAPAPQADLRRLKFAFASCQQYEQGYYAAYRHMLAEDIDLVVFLGDYIYESSWGRRHVRKHSGPEPTTLAGYRNRHAQYKTDPDLQRMHAAVPWLVIWDDHEVSNDYANEQGQFLEADFVQRRTSAYRAYYEHMPLERAMLPRGPDMRLYERFAYGRLALFHMLDDRQYRDIQVCPHPKRGGGSNVIDDAACPERHAAERSLLGMAQERWLHAGLDDSRARWNILAQQTLMAQIDRTPGPDASFWTDAWDGYPAARKRLLDFIAARKPANPVVIGGDVHTHYVCDLKRDFDRPESPTLATQFCGTSISSQSWSQQQVLQLLPDNPHIKFASSEKRGYVVMEVSARQCQASLRGLDDEKLQASGISTQARFILEDGRSSAERV